MTLPGLTIIGERINPGFASSKALLDSRDIPRLQDLAVSQVEKGAGYLTINVGDQAGRDTAFLSDVIRSVQRVVDTPLSFDCVDPAVQEAALKTYDPARARGRKPIVNSITELRWEMVDLLGIQPAKVVLMASERLDGGCEVANTTARQIADTAHRLADRLRARMPQMTLDDIVIDVSLSALASDADNLVRRSLDAIGLIHSNPALRGIHQVVGLSNLSIMLPPNATDGGPLKVRLESSFLTLAMPRGLDIILGTPGRDYRILDEGDLVFRGFKEAMGLDGFDALIRIQQLYRGAA